MIRITAILLLVALPSAPAAALTEVDFREMWLVASLPIRISVGISPIAHKAGITEEILEEVVELGLRRNKIPLPGVDADCRAAIDAIPPGETAAPQECAVLLGDFLEALFGPVLEISVVVLNVREDNRELEYSYHVQMELTKLITLNPDDRLNKVARVLDGANVVRADIWKNGEIGIAGNAGQLRKAVRDFLSEQTDALSLDYHRATAEFEAHVRSP